MAVTAVTLNRSVGGATSFETEIATRDPTWVKAIVLFPSVGFFVLFLLLPLIAVFVEALRRGWSPM